LRNTSVSCRGNQFFLQLFLCGTHGIYTCIYIFSSTEHCAWAIISPKEFKSCVICITVLEHRIICCQIFCDLLLKSAFERIFNVMQLILVKIKWHIKWKYLIQKFHDICLSYYFNLVIINGEVITNKTAHTCRWTVGTLKRLEISKYKRESKCRMPIKNYLFIFVNYYLIWFSKY
jgi:hypothetical protein